MGVMGAVFRREFVTYFITPLAYVFIVIFLALAGTLTFFLGAFFDRGQAAAVLLYDPARDSVVLIEQFRIGALASTARLKKRGPWLIEAVAGVIEAGESAEDVVRREAAEEAGLEPSDLIPMLDYLSSPGCMSESVALYCGRVDASAAGGVHGLDHEHEDIRVLVVPFRQAVEMVESGRFFNAHTIIALYWLALNRDRVRRRWS